MTGISLLFYIVITLCTLKDECLTFTYLAPKAIVDPIICAVEAGELTTKLLARHPRHVSGEYHCNYRIVKHADA